MTRYLLLFLAMNLFTGCDSKNTINSSQHVAIEQNDILKAELSDNTQKLFLYSAEPAITVWDTSTGTLLWRIEKSKIKQPIKAFTHSSKHKLLAIASKDTIQIWHYESQTLFGKLSVTGYEDLASISTLHFSSHSMKLFVGMTDGSISEFNLLTKAAKRTLKHDNNVVYIITDNKDPKFIFTAAHDGKLKKWHIDTGEEVFSVELPSRITSLGLSKGHIFISDGLKTQLVLNADSGRQVSKLTYYSRFKWFRHAIFFEKAGLYLITTSSKDKITLWDVASGKELNSWPIKSLGLGSTVLDIKIVGDKVITVSSDGIIEFLDLYSSGLSIPDSA